MYQPMGLLGFSQGIRSTISKGFNEEILARPEVVGATQTIAHVLAEAGKPHDPLVTALRRRDVTEVRRLTVMALSDFVETPAEWPALWSKLRPEGFLLDPVIFKRQAATTSKLRDDAYFSQYALLRMSSVGEMSDSDPDDSSSSLDKIYFAKSLFLGAAHFAVSKGAFSVAEQLMWWVVLACEAKSIPQDYRVIDSMRNAYSITGRFVSASRVISLASITQEDGNKSVEEWKARTLKGAGKAREIFRAFSNLEGSFESRRNTLGVVHKEMSSLCEAMKSDPSMCPLVVSYALVITPRDGVYDHPRMEVEASNGFHFRLSSPQYVTAGNSGAIERAKKMFWEDGLFNNEGRRYIEYPEPLKKLAEPLRQGIVSVALLKDHVEACAKEIKEHPNPTIPALHEQWDQVVSTLKIIHEQTVRQNLFEDQLLHRLKSCLVQMEVIYYWASVYITPIGKPRGLMDQELELLKSEIKSAYPAEMANFQNQKEWRANLTPQMALRIRSGKVYERSTGGEWDGLISRAIQGDIAKLIPVLYEAKLEMSQYLEVVDALLNQREKINAAVRKSDCHKLWIMTLENLWTMAPEDVDLALWICDLYEEAGQPFESYRRLMALANKFGNNFMLSIRMNKLAPRIIYEDRPPSP